jgi:bacillithiol biosynthesis cysteine-adding enzyme BshC
MTELIVRTDPIGGSPLARAAMEGRLGDWYSPRPTSPQEWKARVESVRNSAVASTWLDVLRPAFNAMGEAATRLHRVAAARGVVVTTGQQPGLFGGPIYTWSKALSALALADEIEARTGVPAAPVFWAANDDADFAEASWTAVATPGGAERLSVAAGAPLGRPMADMPLGDVGPSFEALLRACGATVDTRPIEAARVAYRAGATVGGAYLDFLRAVFAPLGIAVMDAAHASTTAAMKPFAIRALERADAAARSLHARDEAIRAAGFTPQVVEVEGLSLVFERPVNGGDKRRIPLSEAASVAAAVGRAHILSPNVLLRPVIERAILPTATYIAGPGEISYFAQVSAVSTALDLETPMVVPRWSTTIIEPHVARILDRLGIAESELEDPHRAEGRLARESVPAGVTRALDEFKTDLQTGAKRVAHAAGAGGLAVAKGVVDGVERAMLHRLERLERRVIAAVKRQHTDTMTQIGTARGSLFPLGTRQERALNLIPFLARHGSVVVDRMRAAAAEHARHLVGSERGAEAVTEAR